MLTRKVDPPELTDDPSGLSQGERVYEWVRKRVIDGTLKPGSRVREREVAEELGVSRIPIREAFPRLEAEGFLRTLPRRGALVAPMAREDVIELFNVRASLEVLAAGLAAQRCADGVSGEPLITALEAAERAVESGSGWQIATATTDFHEVILDIAGNTLLQSLMRPVQGRVLRLFHIASDDEDTDMHHEHRALCDAIVRGQVARAEALALAHVEHSRAVTLPRVPVTAA